MSSAYSIETFLAKHELHLSCCVSSAMKNISMVISQTVKKTKM